jgi:hypothetical protein
VVIVGTAWLVPLHWLRVLPGALAATVFILMSTNHQNSDELKIWGGTTTRAKWRARGTR